MLALLATNFTIAHLAAGTHLSRQNDGHWFVTFHPFATFTAPHWKEVN